MMDVRVTWNEEVHVPPGVERDDNGGRPTKPVPRKGQLIAVIPWIVPLRSSGMMETEARAVIHDDRGGFCLQPLESIKKAPPEVWAPEAG